MGVMSKLGNTRMWLRVALAVMGYFASAFIAKSVESQSSGRDYPDEIYGLAVIAASGVLPMRQLDSAALGGGIWVAAALANRFDMDVKMPQVSSGSGTSGGGL